MSRTHTYVETTRECPACKARVEYVEVEGDIQTGSQREYYECPECQQQWDMDGEVLSLHAMELHP